MSFYFNKLSYNYSNYPDIKPIKYAIHSTKKKATIHYVDPNRLSTLPKWAQGIGSLNPKHHKATEIPKDCIIEEEVDCVHLWN